MRKKFITIFGFVTIFASAFLTTDILYENILIPVTDSLETTSVNNSDFRYRISVFNGKLAVFEGESKIPYKVYDTYISILPDDDKKILIDGIRVNSSSEMMKIIEEYTS